MCVDERASLLHANLRGDVPTTRTGQYHLAPGRPASALAMLQMKPLMFRPAPDAHRRPALGGEGPECGGSRRSLVRIVGRVSALRRSSRSPADRLLPGRESPRADRPFGEHGKKAALSQVFQRPDRTTSVRRWDFPFGRPKPSCLVFDYPLPTRFMPYREGLLALQISAKKADAVNCTWFVADICNWLVQTSATSWCRRLQSDSLFRCRYLQLAHLPLQTSATVWCRRLHYSFRLIRSAAFNSA